MVVYDVVSFGSAVVDTFVSSEISEKKGEMVLPVGMKILVSDLKFDVGGGATNVGVAFSRFGFKTGCICGVGSDNNGKNVLDLFKREKIAFLGSVDKKKMTGYSVILDSKKRNRTVLTYKGVNDYISFADIKPFKAKWIYYSSMLGKSFETQKKLARKMVKEGTKLALNPSSYAIKRMDISELLKNAYVLILNKEEAEMLCKRYKRRVGRSADPKLRNKGATLMEGLRSLGPEIVVVTDKNKIVKCYDGEKLYSVKPHQNVKVVERTGAGDAFAAGFVSGLMAKKSIKECLELGVKESEAVIGHFGAKNNLIRRNIARCTPKSRIRGQK